MTTANDELSIRIPPALLAAYAATVYEIDAPDGKAVLHVGLLVPEELRALMFPWDNLAIVTAFNPFSTPLSRKENLHRHEVLRTAVDSAGRQMLFGAGCDAAGQWAAEASLAIFDATDDELDDWMLAFGQNAIVVATRGGIAQLRLHPSEVSRVVRDPHAAERSAARLWSSAAASKDITLLAMALHPDAEYLGPRGVIRTVGRNAVIDRLTVEVLAGTEVDPPTSIPLGMRNGQIDRIDLREISPQGLHATRARR